MGKQVSMSRSFAVVLVVGDRLDVYFLARKTTLEQEAEYCDPVKILDERYLRLPWPASDKDKVIELLVKAGLTVRHYDPAERLWLDNSIRYGPVAAAGSREGQWSKPTLEEFERDYLPTM